MNPLAPSSLSCAGLGLGVGGGLEEVDVSTGMGRASGGQTGDHPRLVPACGTVSQ